MPFLLSGFLSFSDSIHFTVSLSKHAFVCVCVWVCTCVCVSIVFGSVMQMQLEVSVVPAFVLINL